MKIILALSALVAVALADAGKYEASYYPSAPTTIDTNADLRVVNGHNAERNQLPYQISLQRRGLFSYSHICGGSIIGKKWILTAAHCVTGTTTANIQIKAGITLLTDTNIAGQQTIQVARIILHELYPGGSQVAPNDMALLELAVELIYSANVQPIAIPNSYYHAQGDVVLSGWGLTRSGGSIPTHLQYVTVPIVENEECNNIMQSHLAERNRFNKELNVCSGIRYGRESACNGDSGGPLVQHGKVVGVVSWGLTPCGNLNAPSVYGKVAAFASWIERNTNGQVKPE